jgi:sugar lactone lactonase YvrE
VKNPSEVYGRIQSDRARRFLRGVLAALLLATALPSVLGWRLIATYAAIPRFHATLGRVLEMQTPEIRPPAAGGEMVVAPDGAVFVSDLAGGRVLAFPDAGEDSGFILAREVEGHPIQPRSLAWAPDGTLWVLDQSTGRVHVFTRAGRLLRSLPLASPGDFCLAIDAEGGIYVGDNATRTILKYLPDGKQDVSWGDASPGSAGASGVSALAVSGSRLYAANARTLTAWDHRGKLLLRRRLKAPVTALASDLDGLLYASDISTNRVWIYGADGRLLARVVGPGDAETLFFQPRGLAVRRKTLYVVNETRIGIYRLDESRPHP